VTELAAATPLPLAGSRRKPLVWLVVLMMAPLAGMVAAIGVAQHHAMRAGAAPLPWLFVLPPLLLLVCLVILRKVRNAGARIERGELVVDTSVGTRRFALSTLRRHGLRVVDLDERSELRPWLRTWGTGLPGFAGGWFRLRNGDKAVCLLLDRRRVSWLRSDDGTTLLLSLAEPETLRARLENASAAAR
jgi:hypothetical protein